MGTLKQAAVLLSLFLAFFWFTDVTFCASLSSEWTAGVLMVGLVLGALGTWKTPRKPRALFLLGYASLVLLVRLVDWDTRKPFLRDLYSLRPGMTVAEVDGVMGRYMRGTGWPANPLSANRDGGSPSQLTEAQTGSIGVAINVKAGQLEIEDSVVFRHTNEGWADSDWGVVRYSGGRVVSVNFYPD